MDITRPTTRALNVSARDITQGDVSSTEAVITNWLFPPLEIGENDRIYPCFISRSTITPNTFYVEVFGVIELDTITLEAVAKLNGKNGFTVRHPRTVEEFGFLSVEWIGVWRHRGLTELVIVMKPASPPTSRSKRGGPAQSRLEIYRAAGLIEIFNIYGRLHRDCKNPAELPGEDAKSA